MKCVAIQRDDRFLCRRCLRTFPIRQDEFEAIGADLTRIHRNCIAKAWITPPGEFLKRLIYFASDGKAIHGVSCEHFANKMNHWGWFGCWRHRADIIKRIRSQAKKEGFPSSNGDLVRLGIVGAWRWILKRNPA